MMTKNIYDPLLYSLYPNLQYLHESMARIPAYHQNADVARELFLEKSIQRFCQCVPYYQTPAYTKRITSISELSELPLLTYANISAYREQFIAKDTREEFFIFSGGSTSGRQKIFSRCLEEFTAMSYWEFSNIWHRFPDAKKIVKIDLVDVEHGATRPLFQMDSSIEHYTLPITEASHYEVVNEIFPRLFRQGEKNVARFLEARWLSLRSLTAWAIENGVNFRSLKLDEIKLGGWVVTQRWKSMIEEVWGIKPTELYGLTEFHQGHSSRSPGFLGFHFRSTIVPELIDPSTGLPAKNDIGELVLTHLYPYSLVQPFIRYRTGDICQKTLLNPQTGDCGYIIRGRIKDCLFGEDGKLIFSAMEIVEALDGLPWVQYDNTNVILDGIHTDQMGLPKFTCQFEKHIQINIPVRFPLSKTIRNEQRQLITEIEERLAKNNCYVSQLLESDQLRITLK